MPFFHSEYRCHLLIGLRNTCWLNFLSSASTLSYWAFFIIAETASGVVLGCNCTYIRKELLPHWSAAPCIHLLLAINRSQLEINFISLNSVLCGRSSYIPVTFTSISLSILII